MPTREKGKGCESLDWNQRWQDAKQRAKFPWDRRQFWNRRAPEFARHAASGTYAEKFLAWLEPRADWSLLDIGCGPGTLALPLAPRVSRVTALDISEVMLEILESRCREKGVANIRSVRASWDDDWQACGVGPHDVAVASRSFYPGDLAAGIAKLNATARQWVVVAAPVGDGPYDRQQYAAVGRLLDRGPDYIYILNYLHQIGIYAGLRFIEEREDLFYPDLDAALAGQLWMFQNTLNPEEERRLREHLAARLVRRDNGWVFPEPKIIRWAYLEWNPRKGSG